MYLSTTTNIFFNSQNKIISSEKIQSELIPYFFGAHGEKNIKEVINQETRIMDKNKKPVKFQKKVK